jgi:hypothetical protein
VVDLHQANIGVFRQLNLGNAPPPAPGTSVDGFDTGGSGWSTVGGSISAGTLEQQSGQTVLRWDYRADAGNVAVLGRGFTPAQNWTGSGAIAVTLGGEPTGKPIYVRVAVSAGANGVEYWESYFSDVSTGTAAVPGGRVVVVPWSGFLHVDSSDHIDLKAPIPLGRVLALVFGAQGQGQGSLTIERVALEPGSSDWGWPWHPALTRHSLPPWR